MGYIRHTHICRTEASVWQTLDLPQVSSNLITAGLNVIRVIIFTCLAKPFKMCRCLTKNQYIILTLFFFLITTCMVVRRYGRQCWSSEIFVAFVSEVLRVKVSDVVFGRK